MIAPRTGRGSACPMSSPEEINEIAEDALEIILADAEEFELTPTETLRLLHKTIDLLTEEAGALEDEI